MKPSSNVCGTTTKVPSKREDKKRINIRWNSGIFFQIGLVVSLLAMFFIMEIEIDMGAKDVANSNDRIWETIPNITYVLETKPAVVPKEKPKKTVVRKQIQVTKPISQTFVKVADNSKVIEGKTIAEGDPVTTTPTLTAPEKKGPETKNMVNVEFAPIYPGCEGAVGKTAKIECLSSKIRAFIGKKFETDAFNYFEPGSIQSIRTMFTIDRYGNIVDIKIQAKDKKLEAEALRVIKKLPVMTPGRQGDTKVNVTYAVPIRFKVTN